RVRVGHEPALHLDGREGEGVLAVGQGERGHVGPAGEDPVRGPALIEAVGLAATDAVAAEIDVLSLPLAVGIRVDRARREADAVGEGRAGGVAAALAAGAALTRALRRARQLAVRGHRVPLLRSRDVDADRQRMAVAGERVAAVL